MLTSKRGTAMVGRYLIRLCGAISLVMLAAACEDTGTTPLGTTMPMPFDPSGSWEAQVQGLLRGSQVDGPMVITLSVVSDFTATGGPTHFFLLGGWEWGGLAGTADASWTPADDAAAKASGGGCPDMFHLCSLWINLSLPPDSCGRIANNIFFSISLLGWFDGPMTMVGARLEGTYWEGGSSTQPCPGPVLISLDTEATFARI